MRPETVIATSIMNRSGMLDRALPTWLDAGYKVFIEDYSSNPMYFTPGSEIDENVKILRTDDEKYFNIGRAKNLAINFAIENSPEAKFILALDCDVMLMDEIITAIPEKSWCKFIEDENIYYNGLGEGLNGSVLLSVKAFREIGGYDERPVGRWSDDSDLQNRLQRHGFLQGYIRAGLEHIPHEGRWDNYPPRHEATRFPHGWPDWTAQDAEKSLEVSR